MAKADIFKLNKELRKHKEFYVKVCEFTMEDYFSKKIAYETMLWLSKAAKNRDLARDLEINPNFYKYKRNIGLDIYEDMSYDCHFVRAFLDASHEFLFSSVLERDDKSYIYFIVYLLNEDFDYNIEIFNNDWDYQIKKEFWDI